MNALAIPNDVIRTISGYFSDLADVLAFSMINKHHYQIVMAPLRDENDKQGQARLELFVEDWAEIIPDRRPYPSPRASCAFSKQLKDGRKHGKQITFDYPTGAIDELFRKYHAEGNVAEKKKMISQLRANSGGTLSEITHWKLGKRHGEETRYTTENELYYKAMWANGGKEGNEEEYVLNDHQMGDQPLRGSVRHITPFVKNEKHGKEICRSWSGKNLRSTKEWKNGVADGVEQNFDQHTAGLTNTIIWKNGKKMHESINDPMKNESLDGPLSNDKNEENNNNNNNTNNAQQTPEAGCLLC